MVRIRSSHSLWWKSYRIIVLFIVVVDSIKDLEIFICCHRMSVNLAVVMKSVTVK
jgi:hypothetical protein